MKNILNKLTILCMTIWFWSCTNSSQIEKLVGMNVKSSEVQDFLKDKGTSKISRYDTVAYHCYKDNGFEMITDVNDVVTSIFIFGEGKNDYKQFQGELPHGLSFTDTKEMCRNKFGKPKSIYDGNKQFNMQCCDTWDGISITYSSTNPTDMSATISEVLISKK